MDKKIIEELNGKKVKIVLENNYYYKARILSVGDDYVKILDMNGKTSFIVLEQIKVLEIEE